MVDVSHLRSVSVSELRYGLYVVEPDRPWTEIPLMFQGFEISTDEELEVLQSYCERVYVDEDRCTADALEALGRPVASTTDPDQDASLSAPRPETDTANAFGAARYPDTARFERLLRRAWESRTQTRRFVEAVFRGLGGGELPDTRDGRVAVADLLQTVTANPGAAVWLSNLDERDAPTSVHSINVCILALTFGAHLGLERAELERIGLGALLHDTGKLFMPPDIRDKAGTLTDSEWDIARRHPQDGYDILVEKGDFPDGVLDIVRLHHERLDGGGYPSGRAGVALPLPVRVVALANAYDSLTSERVYRAAMPADKALQQLYNGADATFGSRLVQEFIRCVGIYPAGSLVELDNGAAGVVLGSRPDARIQPTVLLVRTPDGAFYRKRVVLNLAAEAENEGPAPARHIRRALNPAEEEIDVAGIVAIEFGLEAAG
jgi:HD-GYP domain-containing protein (c-di-GMP phosphodiesterase class II)